MRESTANRSRLGVGARAVRQAIRAVLRAVGFDYTGGLIPIRFCIVVVRII